MRYILTFWAAPLGFFWGWYFLSFYDMSGGFFFFSRQLHDMFFGIYGHMLGIDPQALPGMVARACVVDTLLICAIWAFRRRKSIMAWFNARRLGDADAARRYAEIVSSRKV